MFFYVRKMFLWGNTFLVIMGLYLCGYKKMFMY